MKASRLHERARKSLTKRSYNKNDKELFKQDKILKQFLFYITDKCEMNLAY